MKTNIKFSIRKKIFLFVVLALTVLIGLIIWQIRSQALKASDQTIQKSLGQSSIILNTVLEGRYYFIKEVANSISKDGRVLPLVFEKESLTLQDLSLEFKQAFEFDSLFFIDDSGVVLARSDRPDAIGRSIKGRSPLFDDALQGKTTQGFIVSQGRVLQIIVEPIFDNVAKDVVRGLVAAAYALSSTEALQVSKLTESDVGFYIFTRDASRQITGIENIYLTNTELASQSVEYLNSQPDLWNNFNRETTGHVRLELNEEDYFSAIKKITSYDGKPLGMILTLRSRDELMRPFLRIENAVLLIGLLCLIGSIIVAIFFAIRISRPILELVDMATDIEEGKYPTQQLRDGSPRDEIELLHNSVVRMGKSIEEKNELETYLADLANTIEAQDEEVGAFKPDNQAVDIDLTVMSDQGRKTLAESTPEGIKKRALDRVDTGDLFDSRYQLLSKLGSGLFGRVFLAQDTSLDESIAIKIIDKKRLDHSELEVDLHEEIKLARRITHRNITRTYDFGTHKQFLYITMEYVEGFTLNKLIQKNGAISPYPAMIFVKQLCSALNAAHEQGIIHRDLKPQNIGINQQGVLKIMDFGLAVSLKSISEQKRLQMQKIAAGTPRFMAPEQFDGGKIDERTDIYALGVLMFYIFSGDAPYGAKDFMGYAQAHANNSIPRLHKVNPTVPEPIAKVCFKAMQKRPSERYQTARGMIEALNKIDDFRV